MPQISPIFWSLIVLILTTTLMINKEMLPEMSTLAGKENKLKNKEKSIKW